MVRVKANCELIKVFEVFLLNTYITRLPKYPKAIDTNEFIQIKMLLSTCPIIFVYITGVHFLP